MKIESKSFKSLSQSIETKRLNYVVNKKSPIVLENLEDCLNKKKGEISYE